ncbi:hypothetical protein [Methylobacterium sp. E-066]|uniref:hypothetical protein n=1 Tax=Methylobacterium sp. E-066 TaxID=2836584 RepID=UPI001FB90EEC|nr:hypothetical protein [Methylobacterium sp. E-066]MCJ2142954.1 hypothetical protein [Methylobacterium sp. E-066]
MSFENLLLCAILGVPLEGENALSALIEDLSIPPLPLALALARTGRIDELCKLLLSRSDMPPSPLAACGLFVALTGEPGQARSIFTILRGLAPLDPDVWLSISRFEAVVGDEAAALRAASIHAELSGIPFQTPTQEDAAPAKAAYGSIRLLRGDVHIEF